jgi:3-oxoacyl-[acyl-carrier-protein] synthase I
MSKPKVFVTGIGLITCIGNDQATVIGNLREMRHGLVRMPAFDQSDTPIKVAGPVRGFDVDSLDFEDWTFPSEYSIRRETLRGLAPHGVYAFCAMQQCLADAKLGEGDTSNPRTGLYAASGGSPRLLHANLNKMEQFGVMRCSPTGIVAAIAGTLNFNLVAAYKIRGASCGFSSACASSGHALGFAYDEIALGRQDRMFVVGAEDLNRESAVPFAGMRALSLEPDPNKASRPFDAGRNGFVCTGGAVVLLLESEAEVSRRGVTPYAELMGWGQGSDGHSVAMSHPDGRGLREAMERALAACSLRPDQVDYVNAHATSTPIGDVSELRALKQVFAASRPPVSSTKALTGHGLSLASSMEAAFCCLAIKENFTPGSAHIERLDPESEGVNVIQQTLPQGPAVAMSNSSGFGGANVSLVFRRS